MKNNMSLFENYKILHGLPKEGQKIIFKGEPVFSWFTNIIEDSKKLIPGQEYTVRKTQLNSSSTYVWLEEFPNILDPESGSDRPFFSMHSFKWELPEIDPDELVGFADTDLRLLDQTYGEDYRIKIGKLVKPLEP